MTLGADRCSPFRNMEDPHARPNEVTDDLEPKHRSTSKDLQVAARLKTSADCEAFDETQGIAPSTLCDME